MAAWSPPGTRQTSPRVPGPNHPISSAVACRRCSMGCTLHLNCQVQPWTRSSLPRHVPMGQSPPSRSDIDNVSVKGAGTGSLGDVGPSVVILYVLVGSPLVEAKGPTQAELPMFGRRCIPSGGAGRRPARSYPGYGQVSPKPCEGGLLVGRILPGCALLAPCQPGVASVRRPTTGTYSCADPYHSANALRVSAAQCAARPINRRRSSSPTSTRGQVSAT